jgi:hypothetical protein
MSLDEMIDEFNRIASGSSGSPLTPVTFKVIGRLCEAFTESSPEDRGLAFGICRPARDLLLSYAWAAAVEAVRRDSQDLVVSGLTALALEGGRLDIRDTIVRLAVLRHSSKMLNMDADQTFGSVAALSSDGSLAVKVRDFPTLVPDDLSKFFVRATGNGLDFRYESIDPPKRRWWRFWST